MPNYTHTTLAQAKAMLARRLKDPDKIFWVDLELESYLKEALRTWGAITGAFMETAGFTTTIGEPFYDLKDLLVDGDGVKLLDRALTDRVVVNDIQYALLEPASDWSEAFWIGTEQFTMEEVIQAVQRRKTQFLLETGQVVKTAKIILPSPPINEVLLDEQTINVRRVAWIGLDSSGNEVSCTRLWETDAMDLNRLSVGWNLTPGTPSTYALTTVPQPHVTIAPPPSQPGKLHLTTINSGTDLEPTMITNTSLNLLDSFVPIIKWGALADLLGQEGPGHDPERAQYCQKMWEMGIAAAQSYSPVVTAYINNVGITLVSLFDLDSMSSSWQFTSGQPTMAAFLGANKLALSPVPDAVYSVMVEVARNAIVPTADDDYLQIGREYLDTLLDYAQSLAAFKQAGAEFQQAIPMAERFIEMASRFNSELAEYAHLAVGLRTEDQRGDLLEPRELRGSASA